MAGNRRQSELATSAPDPAIELFVEQMGTWGALAATIAADDLPEDIKKAALEALPVLEKLLGQDFLATSLRTHNPVALEWLTNHAPWTRQDMAIVAHQLEVIQGIPGSPPIIQRLGQSQQSSGAVYELGLASRALDRGLRVELEPETTGNRRCDLRVSLPEEPVFVDVEATTIGSLSADQRLANEVFHRVVPPWKITTPQMVGGSRFLRLPGESELADLFRRADEFWEGPETVPVSKELVIPNLLVMWRCADNDAVAREHFRNGGYPDRWEGPAAAADPFRRIALRVADKLKQLPDARPSVIVIAPPPLSMLHILGPAAVASELSRMISALPQLNAVALHHVAQVWGPLSTRRDEFADGNLFLVELRDQIGVVETLIAWNPNRAFVTADKVIRTLFE